MPDRREPASGSATFLAGAILVFAVMAGNRQLLSPVSLTTRDHIDSYLRSQQYTRELADGHWPQTLPDAVQGGGSAFPRYYPPISPWAAVAAYLLTGDAIAGTHLAGLAAILLAALACFLALRLLGAAALPSSVGAALYTLLPYPWVALNVRGAFAETWALVFHPLLLAGFVLSLRREQPVRWLPLVVGALLASHLVVAAWAIPVLAAVALVASGPELRWRAVWRTGAAAALGVGLAGLFILPPLLESGGLRVSDPVIMQATPEALGGVDWSFYESVFRTFPWWDQLEWAALGIGTIGLWRAWRDAGPTLRVCWGSLVAFAGLSILVRAEADVWRLVPAWWRLIQFPERLTSIAGLFLAASLATVRVWARGWAGRILALGLGAALMLHAYFMGGLALPRSGERHAQVMARLEGPYPDRGLTVAGEYLPKGVEPESLAASIRRTREEIGRSALKSWTRDGGAYVARVELPESGEVPLPLVAYAFHRVIVDDARARTGARSGQLTAYLEAGTHTLRVERRWPSTSWAGMGISLVSLTTWAMWFRRNRRRKLVEQPA